MQIYIIIFAFISAIELPRIPAYYPKDLLKIVQDVLNQRGYDCGTPDGIAGKKTKSALKDYLNDNKDSDGTDSIILQLVFDALDPD